MPSLSVPLHDDIIVPFQIEGVDVRGRVARLGPAVDIVLNKHDYPAPVSRLLGEALLLAAMLGSALKFDGTLTLQARGDGPVQLLVADYITPGQVRGYAGFDRAAIAGMPEDVPTVPELLGRGYLAMTIDQGADMERYQGIVELTGESLADCAHRYFRDSEQIATAIKLAVARVYARDAGGAGSETWRAGGIMVQHLPKPGQAARPGPVAVRPTDDPDSMHEGFAGDEADYWRRARLLLETVADDELTDPTLSPERLLYRLYHEDGVRAFTHHGIAFGCRCSRHRVEEVLNAYPRGSLADMTDEEGRITARCEFCDTVYVFDPDAVGHG